MFLVQLYERRVLTYTPANAEGFKVEMGNVGQPYFRWRYNSPQTTLTQVWEIGRRDLTGMKETGSLAVDGQGNINISGDRVAPVLKYNTDGKLLARIGIDKSGNYLLNSPGNFAISRVPGQAARVYILDSLGLYPDYKVVVREFDSDGNLIRSLGARDNEKLNVSDPYNFCSG